MVASIGGFLGWKFREWRTFYELEPHDDVRSEFGLARLVQVLIHSDKPLSELLMPFGDRTYFAPLVKQSIEQQERMIDSWISGSNASLRERGITQ